MPQVSPPALLVRLTELRGQFARVGERSPPLRIVLIKSTDADPTKACGPPSDKTNRAVGFSAFAYCTRVSWQTTQHVTRTVMIFGPHDVDGHAARDKFHTLARDAGHALGTIPDALPIQATTLVLADAYQRWVCALFDIAWQGSPSSGLHSARKSWVGHVTFPHCEPSELEPLRPLIEGNVGRFPDKKPDHFFSELDDAFRASARAIDILLAAIPNAVRAAGGGRTVATGNGGAGARKPGTKNTGHPVVVEQILGDKVMGDKVMGNKIAGNQMNAEHSTILYRSNAVDSSKIVRDDHSTNGGSKPQGWIARLSESMAAQVVATLLAVAIIAVAIWNWPWIKEFLG